ncbi:UNVERIFIED_CONTAM: hypothetical protein GTU68_042764 [Idotea baltica]|nr:hypothetical protein [Idotea baltica]
MRKSVTFDYVIVGAGSAGCVLANRLSADSNRSILLLEAGGQDRDPRLHIPGAYGELFKKSFDWGFWSEPQEELYHRKLYLPRGKTLGGCSSTNAMAYVRGHKIDYDRWAEMGNPGWSFEDVLPYFIKSENNEQIAQLDSEFHAKGGPLNVTFQRRFQTPFAHAFLDACEQVGIPRNGDYNGRLQEGCGFFQFTMRNGKRHSAVDAFLRPVLERPNLEVRTHASVVKIMMNGTQVTGVQYKDKFGALHMVHSGSETILSAGAFKSPQLLMLSGIGDQLELEKHDIKVVHDLPGVGKNLQDHLFFPISATAKSQEGLNHHLRPLAKIKAIWNYLLKERGPLVSGPLEAVAFTKLYESSSSTNFQFHFAPMHIGRGYNYDMYDLKTYPHTDGFTILPTILKPHSRGEVVLRGADPHEAPKIAPNFLSDDRDLNALVEGGQMALEMLRQDAFRPHLKEVIAPPDLGSQKVVDALKKHIRKSVETVYHPVGTCKMGKDSMAVVNADLQVHGMDGLRVVDASIMPEIISGNTNAPVYMIAEKAADVILGNR